MRIKSTRQESIDRGVREAVTKAIQRQNRTSRAGSFRAALSAAFAYLAAIRQLAHNLFALGLALRLTKWACMHTAGSVLLPICQQPPIGIRFARRLGIDTSPRVEFERVNLKSKERHHG